MSYQILKPFYIFALSAISISGADQKLALAKKETIIKEKADLAAPAPKSVFTIDKNSKDPFFPKSNRPAPQMAETPVQNTTVDVVSSLRAGFQAIMGAGEKRLAVINNAILERGHVTSVRFGPGANQFVKVRVLEVLKDSVVLEIQGYNQPVTLTRPESSE